MRLAWKMYLANCWQNSPASNGREFAKLIPKITIWDFPQMFLKDFFVNWNARRAAWDAVPWACQHPICISRKLFFHFFLGDSRGLRESLFSERRTTRRHEKPNRNQIKMKYLPTLDLWNNATQQAVLTGQIKLQCGQWVKCGNSKPSRFVKTTGRSLWVAHPQGTPAATRERFLNLVSFASR